MIFDVPRITTATISTVNPVNSSVVYNTDLNVYEYWDGSGWRIFGNETAPYTGEPTGFPIGADGEIDRTSSSLSFNAGTRVFSIAPTNGTFSILIQGKIFVKNSTQTTTIGSAEGLYHIYFDTNGNLTNSTTFGLEIIYKYVYVASVYWDATNSVAVHIGDERHGCTMDGHTHARIHQRDGAIFISGMALNSFVVDANGSSDSHSQFSIASGAIRDEDILHTRTAIGAVTSIPVLYRSGTAWRKTTVTAQKAYSAPSGRLYWNALSAGNYSLTQAANNRYVLYHIVATNDKDFPFFSIMGTGEYQTKPEAQTAAIEEIKSFSGLPFVEFVVIGTVIFQTSDSFTNSLKAAVVSTAAGTSYVDWRFSGPGLNPTTANATTHNNLGGIQGGGNGNYYHSNQAINTDSSPTFGNLTVTNNLVVSGNFTVDGTTTNINAVNLVVTDKNIEIGKVSTPTDLTAAGGGITLKGSTDKTITWLTNGWWESSEDLNLVATKTFKIGGTTVLSSSQVLGKSVPSGTIVGTSDSQTLTNKTLDAVSIIGNISTGTIRFNLTDNTASSLAFDTAGKTGMLEFNTTNGAEKVKVNSNFESTGLIQSTAGIQTIDMSNSTYTLNFSLYNTNTFRIQNPATMTFSNGVVGNWYFLLIESDGGYGFTSEVRFPIDNAAPVASTSGKVDAFSLLCVAADKFVATFAFQYTNVF